MFLKIVQLYLAITFVNCAKLPSGYERCVIGNAECVRRTAQSVIDSISVSSDYKKFNLPEANPFHTEKILIQQGGNSPVTVELILESVDVFGLDKLVIKKIEGFERGFKKPIVIDYYTPEIKLKGNYTIDGRVLILPIIGNGLFSIELTDVTGTLKIKPKLIERNGKDHIKIQSFKTRLTVSRMQLHLDNLYNGNKLLGDNTNLFINENWRLIFDELKEVLFEVVGQVIAGNSDSVLSKFSYTDLFIDDQYKKV